MNIRPNPSQICFSLWLSAKIVQEGHGAFFIDFPAAQLCEAQVISLGDSSDEEKKKAPLLGSSCLGRGLAAFKGLGNNIRIDIV